MRQLLIGLLILCATVSVAHNSKIATYTLRNTGSGWFIEMAFAQSSIDGAINELFGDEATTLSPEDFKNEVINYIKDNFRLNVNGKDIRLGSGGILLGSHQTDLKFLLSEMPPNPERMTVSIPAFDFSYNHTNIFRIYQGGETLTKFFLSSDNDFSVNLLFDGSQILEKEKPPHEASSENALLIIGSLILLTTAIIFIRKKLTPQLAA